MTSPRTGRPYLDAVLEQPGSVLAMAHRGGSPPAIAGLENTLAAFEHAVGLGYDYLETDAQVTSDGVLVAFHDDELDRLTADELMNHTYIPHQAGHETAGWRFAVVAHA